jgi:hypothetical protein
MIAGSIRKDVVFNRPFVLTGIDRTLPAGSYRVVTAQELIEGIFLSSPPPHCDHEIRAGANPKEDHRSR